MAEISHGNRLSYVTLRDLDYEATAHTTPNMDDSSAVVLLLAMLLNINKRQLSDMQCRIMP